MIKCSNSKLKLKLYAYQTTLTKSFSWRTAVDNLDNITCIASKYNGKAGLGCDPLKMILNLVEFDRNMNYNACYQC